MGEYSCCGLGLLSLCGQRDEGTGGLQGLHDNKPFSNRWRRNVDHLCTSRNSTETSESKLLWWLLSLSGLCDRTRPFRYHCVALRSTSYLLPPWQPGHETANLAIVHQTPRVLILWVTTDFLSFLIVACYALHTGCSAEEIAVWWRDVSEFIPKTCQDCRWKSSVPKIATWMHCGKWTMSPLMSMCTLMPLFCRTSCSKFCAHSVGGSANGPRRPLYLMRLGKLCSRKEKRGSTWLTWVHDKGLINFACSFSAGKEELPLRKIFVQSLTLSFPRRMYSLPKPTPTFDFWEKSSSNVATRWYCLLQRLVGRGSWLP